MNKLWSICNYSANIILALIIILIPYFEIKVIASTLLLINMISFTIQIFKEDKNHKFLIFSNLFLTAYFLGNYTFFKREALLHIGGAFYILWLIFAFILDLTMDWQKIPVEKFFSSNKTKNKHLKKKNLEKKKEQQTKIEKTRQTIEKEEELDEDFENYNFEQQAETELDEEDDFEIQEVSSKEKLPYKLFTKKGTTTLHREDCRTLRKVRISDLVEIHSMEEANAYDLKKCKVCKPGE